MFSFSALTQLSAPLSVSLKNKRKYEPNFIQDSNNSKEGFSNENIACKEIERPQKKTILGNYMVRWSRSRTFDSKIPANDILQGQNNNTNTEFVRGIYLSYVIRMYLRRVFCWA